MWNNNGPLNITTLVKKKDNVKGKRSLKVLKKLT
jgi:hypothetical protein